MLILDMGNLYLGNGTGCTGIVLIRSGPVPYGMEWDILNRDTKRNGTEV